MNKIKYLLFVMLFVVMLSACGSKELTINFVTGTSEQIETITVKSGKKLTNLPTPQTREGYTFDGWFLDREFKTKYTNQTLKKDTTLYAKWVIKTFKVTFKDGDQVLKTETVEYGKSAQPPTVTPKEGYTFYGWDKNFDNVKSDLVVNAVWNVKKLLVTFITEDNWVIAYVEVEYGKDATPPTPPTRDGYEFDHWEGDYTNVTSDVTIKAVYKKLTYEVRFFVDGVQVGETQLVKYGEAAQAPANPTKEGYTFVGWDKEFSNVTGNLNINAVWEPIKFTVKFVDEDDTVLLEVEVEYGKDATPPTPPTKEGFQFDRWDGNYTNVKSNITVKAVYKVATFEVKFFANGVQVGETQIIEYGKDAVAPQAPTLPGKEFSHWDKEFTNIKSNLVVNAVYTLLTYEIKYYFEDQVLNHTPNHYTIDDTITLTPYQIQGYIFLGWYLNSELTNGPVTELDPTELKPYILYGKYLDADTVYNIDFELNGGSWTWTANPMTDGSKGIVSYSNLPHMFTLDFFIYLRDNDLLTSPVVNSMFHRTTWAEFSAQNPYHNGDPYALYNDTSSNTGQTNDGYSQLFFDTATGDPVTGELIDIQGGFLGTEPYKSKYLPLVKHIARLFHHHYRSDYQNNRLWSGPLGKTLMGFVLDGYFYGTQSVSSGSDIFKQLRASIPNTNAEYMVINNVVTKVDVKYNFDVYAPIVDGIEIYLPAPVRENYAFVGWYANPDFTGPKYVTLKAGENIPTKLYAKWEPIS